MRGKRGGRIRRMDGRKGGWEGGKEGWEGREGGMENREGGMEGREDKTEDRKGAGWRVGRACWAYVNEHNNWQTVLHRDTHGPSPRMMCRQES